MKTKQFQKSQYDANYQTKSPLKRLILLVAFTAIMLIVSTYAWFSVQNNVSLTGITGKVESVSGLEISLDGTDWKHELDLSTVTTGGNNIIPKELIPVSTTAQTAYSDGIGQTDIKFYRGTYDDKTLGLTEIAPFVNSADEGYYQVDLYVKNTSDVETPDVINLNSDSSISVIAGGDPDTGIQNTVRLALAKYTGTLEADVLTNTGTTVTGHTWGNIADVAIWEPNAGAHVAEVYNNNDDLVLPTNYASLLTGGKFGATTELPTFALTSATGASLDNVYDWTSTKVAEQYTLKTADTLTTNTALVSADDGETSFSIAGNAIVKVRLYLWLEGQDVDTINHASHGKGVTINLGLTKGEGTGDNNQVTMLNGDGQTYYTLAPSTLSFRSSADIADFQEVQINGETLDQSNYTIAEGSTIINLSIDYLKTLEAKDYSISIVSKTGSPSAGFSVVEPDVNNYGFYYNQPYTAYLSAYEKKQAFFLREDGTVDVIGGNTGFVETGTFTCDGKDASITIEMGTLTGTWSDDGKSIYCNELEVTFALGDESIVADEEYIYIYDDSLGGYDVKVIDRTKTLYKPVLSNVHGYPVVSMNETFMDCNNVTSVIIPAHIAHLGENAFYWNLNLESISFERGCKVSSLDLGGVGVSGVSNLESLTIPDSVTYLYLDGNYKLTNITYEGTIEQWNEISKDTDWEEIPATEVVCSDGTVTL